MVIGLEIFLPCYFGTENIDKSSYLSTAIYSCNWTGLPKSSKKVMITFMEGMMNPKVLTVGKLFTLTLNTFLTVSINTMYYVDSPISNGEFRKKNFTEK